MKKANVKIDERKDYELYAIKTTSRKMKVGSHMKRIVVALVMQAFDDGIAYNQNNLKVRT